MPEILQNTGAKLWSIVDDHDELQTNVFEQLCGSGGKSDIRLIDEAIGKINKNLNGYYFKIVNDKLCICKDSDSGTVNLPLSITDSNGNIALTVDGTSITIDNNGVVHGIIVDDDLNLTSENAIKNKTVKAKFDEIDEKIDSNETTISSHTTAIATLNGDGDGSVKKIANDAAISEVAKVIANAPESLNTLKEISDWISNHEDDASAMNSAIQTNKSDIAILKTAKIDKETGKDLLADTDKANYDSAVSKSHTHDNKPVLDGITNDKVSAWDSVNDKVDKVNGKGLSTEDYTTAEKNKLSDLDDTLLNKLGESIEGNLTFNGDEINVKCDAKLSATSENPVQNKVVKTVIDNLDQAIADAKALRASLEAYGMVKLTESSAVTDSTGLALAATEKNATITGTLANQLSRLNTDSLKISDVVNDFTSDAVTQPLSANRGKWLHDHKAHARFAPKSVAITANQDITIDLGFGMASNQPVILMFGFYPNWTAQYTDIYLLSGSYTDTVFATRLINTTNSNTTRPISGGGNLFSSEPAITFSRSGNGTIAVTINSAYGGSVCIEAIG